jgi:hypothetical protein
MHKKAINHNKGPQAEVFKVGYIQEIENRVFARRRRQIDCCMYIEPFIFLKGRSKAMEKET